MLYIISYDSPDNLRRLKLAKTLLDFGGRVQFSVFEARFDRELLEKLIDRLEKIVDKDEDSVKMLQVASVRLAVKKKVPSEALP